MLGELFQQLRTGGNSHLGLNADLIFVFLYIFRKKNNDNKINVKIEIKKHKKYKELKYIYIYIYDISRHVNHKSGFLSLSMSLVCQFWQKLTLYWTWSKAWVEKKR